MRRVIFLIVALLLLFGSNASAWQERGVAFTVIPTVTFDRNFGTNAIETSAYFPQMSSWRLSRAFIYLTVIYSNVAPGTYDSLSIDVGGVRCASRVIYPGTQSFCIEVPPSCIGRDGVRLKAWLHGSLLNGTTTIRNCGVFCCFANMPQLTSYEGIVHMHSTYSDGKHSLADRVIKVKLYGYVFLVETDHYDLMRKRGWLQSYVNECYQRSDRTCTIFPGVELCSYWYQGIIKNAGHIIAFPWPGGPDPIMNGLDQGRNVAARIIGRCNDMNMFWGIAHSYLENTPAFSFKFNYAEISDYDFNGGIGMSSWGNASQRDSTIAMYSSVDGQGAPVSSYGESDSHYNLDPGDLDKWLHSTVVYAVNKSRAGIFEGFQLQRTIALDGGIVPLSLSIKPDGAYITDIPTFSCRFVFKFNTKLGMIGKLANSAVVRVNRDGVMQRSSERSYAKGTKEFTYYWQDTGALPGYHRYFLVVQDTTQTYVVTSPIELIVCK